VDQLLPAANGNMSAALASLKDKPPEAALQRIALALSLSDWSDGRVSVVKALSAQADITTLGEVVPRLNVDNLATLVDHVEPGTPCLH
jgi:hypothetical protein